MTQTFSPDLFAGKIAVVTGGTSGIGRETAIYLAQHGAKVYAVGLESDAVTFPDGLDIETREVDVTEDAQLTSLMSELDRLDILVPAAGITLGAKELEWESYNRVLSIQLQGVYRTINLASDLLKQSKGTVITIASMYSYFGGGTAVAYSSAKGAIVQLTKSLAEAWGSDRVRVNSVAPGWIKTPLLDQVDDIAPAPASASSRALPPVVSVKPKRSPRPSRFSPPTPRPSSTASRSPSTADT